MVWKKQAKINNQKISDLSWCTNCVMMSTRPRMTFNEKGLCNACQWSFEKNKKIKWSLRKKELLKLLKKHKKKNGEFDCLVPCSGGKDGSYVAYNLKHKYKMNPLCITVNPPLRTEIGKKNLEAFVKSGYDLISVDCNYNAMREEKEGVLKNHFWAFENKPQNIANHLRIRKGDKIIFMIHDSRGLGVETGHQLTDNPNAGLNVRKWIIYEATEPYSISLDNEMSTFFEDGNPEIGKRKWPHFIYFNLLQEGMDYLLEKRGIVSRELVLSSHPSKSNGGPVPLSKTQFDNLKSKFFSSES